MSNKRNGNNNSSIDYQQNHDPRVPYFVTLSKPPLSKLLSRTITNTIWKISCFLFRDKKWNTICFLYIVSKNLKHFIHLRKNIWQIRKLLYVQSKKK